MTEAMVVLVTAPGAEKAAEIARALVDERLAACVNVLPAMRSIYRWQGAVLDEPEVLLVVKSVRERLAAIRERVVALHPYEVPEIVALPVDGGSEPYLAWLAAESRPPE